MDYETHEIKSDDARIAGWYVSNDGSSPSDWTWRNSGSGPEVTADGVFGTFASEAEAHQWASENDFK